MPGIAALRVSNRANSVRYTSLTAFRSLSNLRKLSGVQALDARQEAVSRCSQQQQTNACNATLYNFEKSKMSGSRRTYRTLPLDVPHSPAERIALSRRTSRTLPREVPHSVLHSPAERPSKIDAYFVACASFPWASTSVPCFIASRHDVPAARPRMRWTDGLNKILAKRTISLEDAENLCEKRTAWRTLLWTLN
ncbi:hypothetical protein Bbelb_428820 [Branchiostoma belcheri]|nr:hypothetical protein Bbelb_439010 [Branchiostoma belcheri]KAI8479391.1 hypothetical protein Bbelb_428820 [Branchiostoma belcheri]